MNERFTCKGLTIYEDGEEIHTIKAVGYLNSQHERIRELQSAHDTIVAGRDNFRIENDKLERKCEELEKINKYLLLLLDNLTKEEE